MPLAADRILPPVPPEARRRPTFAALAVTASMAVHGMAVAAAIGLWGGEETTAPEAFEVVMVTLTRPSQSPAPGSASGSVPSPDPARQAGPPSVAMPVAEPAAPAMTAPHPAVADVTASMTVARPIPPDTVAEPPIEPAETTAPAAAPAATADAVPPPPPATLADMDIDSASVARVAEVAPSESPAPVTITDTPVPMRRPDVATAPDLPDDRHPTGTPAADRPSSSPSDPAMPSLAALTGGQELEEGSRGGSRPAAFALGSAGNPAPDYPYRARQRGWQGRVVLRVEVDRQGRPIRIAIAQSSGHGVLDDAAHRTIATWTFRPATRGGQPVAGEAVVPVVFRLN